MFMIIYITVDDETNNLKSSNRKLDHKLTLLVKQKLGDKELWVMPQGELEEGESVRQVSLQYETQICTFVHPVIAAHNIYFVLTIPNGSVIKFLANGITDFPGSVQH